MYIIVVRNNRMIISESILREIIGWFSASYRSQGSPTRFQVTVDCHQHQSDREKSEVFRKLAVVIAGAC